MASTTGVAKPLSCSRCAKAGCQADCKKCPLRLEGACKEHWHYATWRARGLIWFVAICKDCNKALGGKIHFGNNPPDFAKEYQR